MLALLIARNLTQTLLLTILFLLIAVTSPLLACGPVAQPAPGDDGASPAAQTSGGGEPTAEPAEPTITPALESGNSNVEPPTVAPTDTPMPPQTGNDNPPAEPTEPAITPTLERENPTAEPPTETPTNTPTPRQTPVQDDSRIQRDLEPLPPATTKNYPNIRSQHLHYLVIEFEKAQEAKGSSSGQEADAAENSELVELEMTHNAVEIAAWLKERGISPSWPWHRPINADDTYMAVTVPLALMGELSQQKGIKYIHLPLTAVPGN